MVDVGNDADAAGFTSELHCGFDFGEHGAGFEAAFVDKFGEFFGRDFVNGLGVWFAEVNISVWDSGDRNKNIGFDFFGETFSGEIFVDDGIDTF